MNVLVLALFFSDAALNASNAADYRLEDEWQARKFADPRSDDGARPRPWSFGLDGWTRERSNCAALVEREIGGGAVFRFGPRCEDEVIPYARSDDGMPR